MACALMEHELRGGGARDGALIICCSARRRWRHCHLAKEPNRMGFVTARVFDRDKRRTVQTKLIQVRDDQRMAPQLHSFVTGHGLILEEVVACQNIAALDAEDGIDVDLENASPSPEWARSSARSLGRIKLSRSIAEHERITLLFNTAPTWD